MPEIVQRHGIKLRSYSSTTPLQYLRGLLYTQRSLPRGEQHRPHAALTTDLTQPLCYILHNMPTSRLSQSPSLLIAAGVIATLFVGFGINYILRPANALEFFEFGALASASEKKLVDGLMAICGVRDIFMGLAIYLAVYFRDRKSLGCLLIAGSCVAFVDGVVCRTQVGKGEWNHWGYAPVLTAVGILLLGVMDKP